MNIGIFMMDYLPKIGGAQISAHCMANSLIRLGCRVIVYSDNRSVKACRDLGWSFNYNIRGISPYPAIILRHCVSLGRFLLARQMRRAIAIDHLDIIQVVFSWPWIAAIKEVSSECGVPIVVRCAGDDIQVDHEVGYGLLRKKKLKDCHVNGMRHIDKAVAISETVRREYLNSGVPDEKITIIPPGVDWQAFEMCDVDKWKIRQKWGLPIESKLILAVGRNHHKKRFVELVRALKFLNSRERVFAVAIVGKNSEALVTEAKLHGVDGDFFPLTQITNASSQEVGTFPSQDLIELYKAADYFVHPSAIETYANVALEAMAAGTPVIVTAVPGNVETVQDGADGLHIPLNSPEMIAQGILQLESDETLRRRIVRGGREHAQRQDWMQVSEAYLAIYHSLLSRKTESSQSGSIATGK